MSPQSNATLANEEFIHTEQLKWLRRHQIAVFVFLVLGILLLLAAERIGVALSITQSYGSGYSWDGDKAHAVALTVRFLGAFSFMAGLAEYVIVQVAQLPELKK